MKDTEPTEQNTLPFAEFVALMALMIALVALSIDIMLPALSVIADDLGAPNENDRQLILSTLFLGLATAQMLYGPISDSFGRKPTIYVGLGIFIAGTLIVIFAGDFEIMLAGRFLQGLGVAAPRIVTMAIIRDLFAGRAMARVMSLVMMVFILVPVLAPAIGQGVLLVANWRTIFGVLLLLALIILIWFWQRQPETLKPSARAPFSVKQIWGAIKETCTNRLAFGYTVVAGLAFGAFIGYLNTSQQILQEHYQLGNQFPLYFALTALSFGASSYFNAKLVMRYGMRYLSGISLVISSLLAIGYFLYALSMGGDPPLWSFILYLLAAFACIGVQFANFNALALEPMGHIAGVAAGFVGSLTMFIAMSLGAVIGRLYDETVLPLVGGFVVLSIASGIVMFLVERGRSPENEMS